MKQGILSNQQYQDKERKRLKMMRIQSDEDLRFIMSQPSGRRFIWNIISSRAQVFSGSLDTNALAMAGIGGRRAVGVEIMQDAQRIAPHAYAQMITERMEAQEEDDLQREVALKEATNE